jgi:hypothetical protein
MKMEYPKKIGGFIMLFDGYLGVYDSHFQTHLDLSFGRRVIEWVTLPIWPNSEELSVIQNPVIIIFPIGMAISWLKLSKL